MDALEIRIADVFDTLTYRERYQDLLLQAGRDRLTGVPDRGQFDGEGREAVAAGLQAGASVSLIAIDIDDLKGINARLGRPAGDGLLRGIGGLLLGTLGEDGGRLYRHGGRLQLLDRTVSGRHERYHPSGRRCRWYTWLYGVDVPQDGYTEWYYGCEGSLHAG